MKLSIALCTFNGERFLGEQLASIRSQTRPPDEIVIREDASTDGTRRLVEEFARTVHVPVLIESNPTTIGSTRNFAQAIALCTGDAIVLADQDDVWHPHKLAAIEECLLANPTAGFVFSDAGIVDSQLNPLGYSLWDALDLQRTERERFRTGHAFECLLRRHRVTGATMAFRSRHRDLVLPIPTGWVHDAWIALVIAAVAPCALIDESLIQYRQHAAQQHGGRKRGPFAEYHAARRLSRDACDAVADRYSEAFERLEDTHGVSPEHLVLLQRKIDHYRRRADLRATGTWRLPKIVREVWRGNYSRFSRGWKAIAQDLMMR